jgi:hypothetical protein
MILNSKAIKTFFSSCRYLIFAVTTLVAGSQITASPMVYSATIQTNTGKDIYFKDAVGEKASAYYIPAATSSNKVLVILQGSGNELRSEAADWHNELGGIHVIVPYLNLPESTDLSANSSRLKAENTIAGLINYLGNEKEFYFLGFDSYVQWAFEACLNSGSKAKACVLFNEIPDLVNTDKKLKANVFLAHQNLNSEPNVRRLNSFSEHVKNADRTLELHEAHAAVSRMKSIAYLKNAMVK